MFSVQSDSDQKGPRFQLQVTDISIWIYFFLRGGSGEGGEKGLVFQEKDLSTQSWNWSLDLLFLNQ